MDENISYQKLTDVEVINQIIFSFKEYALGDIDKSRKENMLLASFILCACFIDQLSNHRYFKRKVKKEKFILFVEEYFSIEYDAKCIYEELRCKLVHNYSVNSKYLLTDSEPEKHLNTYEGKIWLHIDRFISDVSLAFYKYCDDLKTDNVIKNIALKHFHKYKVLSDYHNKI